MIVAADLEGTLTSGETWKALGRYLRSRGQARAYRSFFLAHLPAAIATKAGVNDMAAFRDRWMSDLLVLFAGLTGEEWSRLAEWVTDEELWPKRRVPVLEELRQHQAAGRQLVLASSTYQPVLEAFARRIGAAALGTRLEMVDDRATGRVLDSVNAGSAKAARLMQWCGGEQLHTAYGDTSPDVPMLELAQTAVVVHPAPALRRLALGRGWRIVQTIP